MRRNPFTAGGLLAVVAALAFGLATPLIKHYGAVSGPFTTAALLYAGAALVSLRIGRPRTAGPSRIPLPRIALVALLGAVIAPACLAWGLHRTDATTASLLLNFEAVLTLLLARVAHAEPIGPRVGIAVALMAIGGGILVTAERSLPVEAGWGTAAVLAACLAWAADNTFSQPLADLDPRRVVLRKAGAGAVLSATLAAAVHDRVPPLRNALALLACGAAGYGLSLRLYLLAQRRIGTARTASVFALAPFVGAMAAWGLGESHVGFSTLVAGALFAVAVYLHLTEQHGHLHRHEPTEHEHAHRHDDEHHDHVHEVYPDGEHTHPHGHEARVHTHPHGPDVHHRHSH